MRGWLVGLVIGLVVGAGAMYLVLRPPWVGGGSASGQGSGSATIAAAPADAGAGKPKRRRPRGAAGGTHAGEPSDDAEPIVLAAADRALEWRGEEVALPSQRIDVGATGNARSLEDGEINTTIGNQTGDVRDCVAKAATGTDLRATITIKLLVDGSGRVSKSRVQAPRYLFEQGVLACAQRALGRLRFPSTGGFTVVTFPVNLG